MSFPTFSLPGQNGWTRMNAEKRGSKTMPATQHRAAMGRAGMPAATKVGSSQVAFASDLQSLRGLRKSEGDLLSKWEGSHAL
jgi:hypothetical protein